MKTFVWISTGLMLIGLLSFSSISLAEEGRWAKKADMPTARAAFSTSVVNGKIYAIGGLTAAGGVSLSTTEEYNPATNTWTKKADMPTARWSLSTSVVNEEIYAIGGTIVIGGVGGNWKTVSKVEVYNPATNRWTEQTDMPTPRGWLSTSAVKGKIYAIGGSSKVPPERIAGLSTVEEFDTGFRAVEAKDKLPTSWGKMKK